jgi:hypothetical protein
MTKTDCQLMGGMTPPFTQKSSLKFPDAMNRATAMAIKKLCFTNVRNLNYISKKTNVEK